MLPAKPRITQALYASPKPRVVIALGGNALQKNGEVSADAQKKVASEVGQTIAELSDRYEIIVSHGNGPQVGNILLHEENAATDSAPAMPLETAVAMSQGQIGYWLAQAIDNASTAKSNPQAASLVTQVVVDPDDPAFSHPSKPIGEFYSKATAKKLTKTRGWAMREDAGRGYRRVVPSPKPIDIVESAAIRALADSGTIVIAAGGGGIPVTRTADNQLAGVDAVIDKDFAAAELARLVQADIFVSVTTVPNVYIHFGEPNQTALGLVSCVEMSQYIMEGYFTEGSMLPKVEAAVSFVSQKSRRTRYGIITSPDQLAAALALKSGTIITE